MPAPSIAAKQPPSAGTRRPHIVQIVTSAVSTIFLRDASHLLIQRGYDVTIICGPGEFWGNGLAPQVRMIHVPMVREMSPLADLRSLWHLWRLLRRLRPDLVEASTPKAGLIGGIAAKLAGVPARIYLLRGLRGETAKGFRRTLLMAAERLAAAAAHRVVCVSPSLRTKAIELGLVSAEKAVVLGAGSSGGVNVERFAPTPERRERAATLRQQCGIAAADPVIGFVGRFTHDKGIAELVAAFKVILDSVSNAWLVLVGDYEAGDPVAVEIRDDISRHPRIRAVGVQKDLAEWYAMFDVFVLPTHREGFPNTCLEAQAMAVPVVTTTATGAVDSVVEGATGFKVPAGDPQALAAAVLPLVQDPALRNRIGNNGRAWMLAQFRPEIIMAGMEQQYRALMQRPAIPTEP